MEKNYSRVLQCFSLVLLSIACSSTFVRAQITYEKLYGGANTESAYRVEICDDGGYVTAGFERSKGPGYANGHIMRMNKYGELKWEYVTKGNAVDKLYAVAITNGGSFIAVGSTTSSGAGMEDIYVVKVDADGNKAWEKTFGGSGSEEAWDIRLTSDGGFIITGVTGSFGASFFDAFLLKIDKDGNKQWLKVYGGGSFDAGFCVRVANDGGYVFLGQTHSEGAGEGDFYLVKTNSSGDVQWSKTYGGPKVDEGRYLQLTQDGGYIVVGKTESYGAGSEDIYVVKIDGNGNKQWENTYGGDKKDTGKSIEPTADGGYIIASSSRSFNWQVPRAWFIKTNGIGEVQWTQNYGGWGHDHGHHILPTSDGGYIATGHFNRVEANSEDAYLLKLNASGIFDPNSKDASIIALELPSECGGSSASKIRIKIKNFGNGSLSSIPVKVELSGGVNKSISETLETNLAPGESQSFTLSETVDLSAGGNVNFKIYTNLDNDAYRWNDTLTKTLNIVPGDAVDLGPDLEVSSQTHILDAGLGFVEYKWSDNSTGQTLTVSSTGTYWVEVKNSAGCKSSDTIRVDFLNNVAGLSANNLLKVFPNPNDGLFFISIEENFAERYMAQVFDYTGRLLWEQEISSDTKNFQVNLKEGKGVSVGLYILKLTGDNQKEMTKKLLVR
jgi:hypothetical protein